MKRPCLMEKLLFRPAYSDVLDVRLLAILKIITLMCCNLAILQPSTTVSNSYAVVYSDVKNAEVQNNIEPL